MLSTLTEDLGMMRFEAESISVYSLHLLIQERLVVAASLFDTMYCLRSAVICVGMTTDNVRFEVRFRV